MKPRRTTLNQAGVYRQSHPAKIQYLDSKEYTYQESKNFWLPLDNAAKIYPAILSDELMAVFRISVVLKHPVKIKHLLKAVHSIEDRFPYYKVQLKKGFFWYYL